MEKEIIEKLEDLIKDEDYVNHLLSLGSLEEVSKELKNEKGLNITSDELRRIVELTKKKADSELSEEELEEVAGGKALLNVYPKHKILSTCEKGDHEWD